MINAAALALIQSFEKCRLTAYPDGYGYSTIGWGHKILPGESFPETGITRSQADDLFYRDLNPTEAGVQRLFRTVHLTDNQYGALVSFAFNDGVGTLQRATFRQSILRGDLEDVPEGMEKYCKAGRPLKLSRGLLRRRRAEVALFTS